MAHILTRSSYVTMELRVKPSVTSPVESSQQSLSPKVRLIFLITNADNTDGLTSCLASRTKTWNSTICDVLVFLKCFIPPPHTSIYDLPSHFCVTNESQEGFRKPFYQACVTSLCWNVLLICMFGRKWIASVNYLLVTVKLLTWFKEKDHGTGLLNIGLRISFVIWAKIW